MTINSRSLERVPSWKALYAVLAICTVLLYGQSLNQPETEYSAFPVSDEISQMENSLDAPPVAVPTFLEQNGRVVFEIESGMLPSKGFERVNVAGEVGYEGTENRFNRPLNAGRITYKIRISTPGIYRLVMRSRIGDKGEGKNSENNDCWMKMSNSNGNRFFGFKGGQNAIPVNSEAQLQKAMDDNKNVVYPKGTGLTPNPGGATADGFFKVFMGVLNAWTWDTRTSDTGPHKIYVKFARTGDYELIVGNRSEHHIIDRIGLYKIDRWGDNYRNNLTNLPESPRAGGSPPPPPSNTAPNADAGNDFSVTAGSNGQAQINLNGGGSDPDGNIVSYQWRQGSTVLANSKNTSVNRGPGTYTFTLEVTDNDGATDTDNVKVTVNENGGGNPPPPPPSGGDNEVTSFTLFDATGSDNSLGELTDGRTINLAQTGDKLNIVANTSGQIGRVEFELTGARTINDRESTAPYALGGDNNGDLKPTDLPVGNYQLKATPFLSGVAGTALIVNFSVVDDNSNPNPDPDPEPGDASVNITSPSNNAEFEKSGSNSITFNADVTGSEGGTVRLLWVNTNRVMQTKTGGQSKYDFDFGTVFIGSPPRSPKFKVQIVKNGQVVAEDEVQVTVLPEGSTPNPEPEPEPGDASVNITSPTGGQSFEKGDNNSITFNADVTGSAGASVRLLWVNTNRVMQTKTGGQSTYSFDFRTIFIGSPPRSPRFKVQIVKDGNVLAEDEVQVTVTPSTAVVAAPIQAELNSVDVTNLYPNRVKDRKINLRLSTEVQNAAFVVRDGMGNVIEEGFVSLNNPTALLEITLNNDLSSGLYFLELNSDHGSTVTRFIKE